MTLHELAAEAGMTIDSGPEELADIAAAIAETNAVPLSAYEVTRALLRMQREQRAKIQWAAIESGKVSA
ncbi:hypothetical protein P5V43_05270 [Mycobacteroides abscessus subsp. bolletii]|uniref:hypothetical protein n=1 Tax=Mycobacteroides abscessus TaxID=36809 RepID=UPI00266B95AF|nr:hypothetical protein [Mycobacteroides abscessus]MDO3126511.1 hypothetical protein [Mycobacteroides abscessus subsp. bolletii]